MKKIALLLACGFLMAGAVSSAQAASQAIGEFKDWTAWVHTSGGTKICYMTSAPKKSVMSKKNADRGDIHFYITHRPGDNIFGEVSMLVGYPLKSEAVVKVGTTEIAMKTDGHRGWPLRVQDSKKLVNLMKAGSTMEVRGISTKGTRTTDTYSLSGVTAAYKAISQTCQ